MNLIINMFQYPVRKMLMKYFLFDLMVISSSHHPRSLFSAQNPGNFFSTLQSVQKAVRGKKKKQQKPSFFSPYNHHFATLTSLTPSLHRFLHFSFSFKLTLMKLNPNADSFFPSPKPNPTSIEPYHQGYVAVSSPSLVPPPPLPPPPYYQQPYFYGGARGGVHDLHPGTAMDGAKKQDDASKRFSKRGFLRHVIAGYGRRLEARRTRGLPPPRLRCLARRPTGEASCDHRIEEATPGNFTRVKKTKQPLAPVERERSTTIMIRNIPNRYTFVYEPRICRFKYFYFPWVGDRTIMT